MKIYFRNTHLLRYMYIREAKIIFSIVITENAKTQPPTRIRKHPSKCSVFRERYGNQQFPGVSVLDLTKVAETHLVLSSLPVCEMSVEMTHPGPLCGRIAPVSSRPLNKQISKICQIKQHNPSEKSGLIQEIRFRILTGISWCSSEPNNCQKHDDKVVKLFCLPCLMNCEGVQYFRKEILGSGSQKQVEHLQSMPLHASHRSLPRSKYQYDRRLRRSCFETVFVGLARTILDHCDGTVPTGREIFEVFNKMGISLVDLLQYFGKCQGISFPVSVSELPMRGSDLPLLVLPRIRADFVASVLTEVPAKKESNRTMRTLTCISMNESGHILKDREGKLPDSKRPVYVCKTPETRNSYAGKNTLELLEGKVRRRAGDLENCFREMRMKTRRKNERLPRSKFRSPIVLKLKVKGVIEESRTSKKSRVCLQNIEKRNKKDTLSGTSLVDDSTFYIGTPDQDLNIDTLPAPPREFQMWHQPILVPGLIPVSTPVLPATSGSEFPFRSNHGLIPEPGLAFSVIPSVDLPNAEDSKSQKEPHTKSTADLSVKKFLKDLNIKSRVGKEVLLTRIDNPAIGILSSHTSISASPNPEISEFSGVWKVQHVESNASQNHSGISRQSKIPKLILKRYVDQPSTSRSVTSCTNQHPMVPKISESLHINNSKKQGSASRFPGNTQPLNPLVWTSFDFDQNERAKDYEGQKVVCICLITAALLIVEQAVKPVIADPSPLIEILLISTMLK
ncbi:unnamed protein product [Allacma fusca]|uniref:Uncharacterized protein n=1 Tax=Allacma fusca TaxID=39272 RepID=A0A8J2KYG2_9HEXA|nr:unnamed protein product [Allacma fusca]